MREPIAIEPIAPSLNGLHPMKLSDVRELLHVTETRTDGALLRACPLHPTMTLAIIIRRDGSLKVECPGGCREAIFAAALEMQTEALLALRVIRTVVRTPIPIDTPISAARDPSGRLLPIAEIMNAQRQAAQDEIWEALKAVEDDKINEMTAEQHLHELTRVDDHVPAVVVEGENTKAQIKEEEKARTRTIYQVRVERNNPELPLFIQRVAKLDRLERPGYLFLANERKLFPGFELKNLKAWLDKVENPPASATAEPAPVNAAELAALREQAAEILDADDPLHYVGAEIRRLGYGGDLRPPLILYINWATRLLPTRRGTLPGHTQTNGHSGGGKSYGNDLIRDLHPPECFVERVATSEKELLHDDESLRHRVLYYAQANSIPGATGGKFSNDDASAVAAFFLTLLQNGEGVYSYSVRDPETGRYVIDHKRREGPTVLITTMVRRLHAEEMDSRLFALDWPDDPEQQYAALMAMADLELGGTIPTPRPEFHAYQRYLQALAPIDVVFPNVRAFNHLLQDSRADQRLLRDAARLRSLIKGIAILRSAHRDRDDHGRVIATLDDYDTMADLIEDMYETTAGVSAKVRELVEALPPSGTTTVTQLAQACGISQSAMTQRLAPLLSNPRQRYVVNSETRPGRAYRLERGDPLPHRCGLPSRAQIENFDPSRGRRVRRQPVLR
jgi:hypothetical protein